MKFPTVDVEQASNDLGREVAQLRRVVLSLRGREERLRMIIDTEPKCLKIPGEGTTAVVRIPAVACL